MRTVAPASAAMGAPGARKLAVTAAVQSTMSAGWMAWPARAKSRPNSQAAAPLTTTTTVANSQAGAPATIHTMMGTRTTALTTRFLSPLDTPAPCTGATTAVSITPRRNGAFVPETPR